MKYIISILIALAPLSSFAWDNAFGRNVYDPNSGNQYNVRRNITGDTEVNGNNVNTGSMWHTTVKQNGDESGTDSHGNMWNYDGQTGTYTNYGTGKTCAGQGLGRICTGGR